MRGLMQLRLSLVRAAPAARAPHQPLINLGLTLNRPFSTTPLRLQNIYEPAPRPSFYRTHGRAFFKCFTLAFFTYQVVYYIWLTFETEYMKDEKEREIKSLEGEVRLLDEGRRAHKGNEER